MPTSQFDRIGGIVVYLFRMVGLAIAAVIIFRLIHTSLRVESGTEFHSVWIIKWEYSEFVWW